MKIFDYSMISVQLFAADSKPPAGPLELLITYFPMVSYRCCGMVSFVST